MRRPLLLLGIAALTACSSSHVARTAAPGTTTAPASSATPSTTNAPGASPTGDASGVPGGSAAGSPSGAGTTGGTGNPQPSASSGPAAPRATAAGTYTYDSSGSQTLSGAKQAVSGTSTLTVGAVAGGSQTSTLHNNQGDTEQVVGVRQSGSYLATLKISGQSADVEFRFAPPTLLLPDPAKAGATWSWGATSTDGSATVKASNKVLRTETVTIGGKQVATVVLQTHLVLTGKNLTVTADTTNWVSPSYRLPVKTHTVGRGSYGAFPFSFDVTDVLRSVHPS